MESSTKDYPNDPRRPIKNLKVRSNGGSVTVQSKVSDGWINTGDVFNADGTYPLHQNLDHLQIVPTGGAEFEYY